MNQEEVLEYRGTDMDYHLKGLAIKLFEEAIGHFANNQLGPCIKKFISLFYMIQFYDFELKPELADITDYINEHLNRLGNKPMNMYDEIQLAKRKMLLKDLVRVYMERIPAAYGELGIWFKVYPTNYDLDKKLSKENFNSDVTLLNDKRKALLKLKTDEIVELLRPSAIHHCYGRLLMQNAV